MCSIQLILRKFLFRAQPPDPHMTDMTSLKDEAKTKCWRLISTLLVFLVVVVSLHSEGQNASVGTFKISLSVYNLWLNYIFHEAQRGENLLPNGQRQDVERKIHALTACGESEHRGDNENHSITVVLGSERQTQTGFIPRLRWPKMKYISWSECSLIGDSSNIKH